MASSIGHSSRQRAVIGTSLWPVSDDQPRDQVSGGPGGSWPVFLVGAQRSGTTALALALSKAFDEAGGCFTVNGRLPYLLRRWWTEDDVRHQHLRADEVEHSLRRAPAAGVDAGAWIERASVALRAGAERAAGREVPTGVEEEVRVICEESYGGGPWGDKYNEYLLDLPWLDRVFPAARWVFIVREPADVVASMLGWRREKVWNPRLERDAVAKWGTWNERWLRFRSSLTPGRAFEIGYRQLAADGGARLSGWLDLDVERHLAGFRARRGSDPVRLNEESREVCRSLARLGLLSPGRGTTERGCR
jgi:Sulfotransferase family